MKKDSKSATPKQPWEILYRPTAETGNKNMDTFLPKKGKDRSVPHRKVNETDH